MGKRRLTLLIIRSYLSDGEGDGTGVLHGEYACSLRIGRWYNAGYKRFWAKSKPPDSYGLAIMSQTAPALMRDCFLFLASPLLNLPPAQRRVVTEEILSCKLTDVNTIWGLLRLFFLSAAHTIQCRWIRGTMMAISRVCVSVTRFFLLFALQGYVVAMPWSGPFPPSSRLLPTLFLSFFRFVPVLRCYAPCQSRFEYRLQGAFNMIVDCEVALWLQQ